MRGQPPKKRGKKGLDSKRQSKKRRVKVGEYQKYTDKDRIKALELLAEGRTLAAVSSLLGIPETTLSAWKNSVTKGAEQLNREKDGFADFRRKKKEEFISEAWEIIGLANKRLKNQLEDTEERISARDLAIISATSFDKQALAVGDSTVNAGIKIVIDSGTEGLAD